MERTSKGSRERVVSQFGGGKGGPKSLVIWVCVDELFRTDGTATWLVDIRDLPELRGLGPMINRLRVHYEAESAGANFKGRMTMAWSVSGRIWSTPVEILAPQTGPLQVIGAWYTTDGNFGLNLRAAVEVANAAGAALESGRLTIAIEVELKS